MRTQFLLPFLLLASQAAVAQTTVGAANAATVVGKGATVCGKVESFRFSENTDGQPTFLHLGGAFPKHTFAVRINGVDRSRFEAAENLVGQMICVTGNVAFAQGNVPEMVISKPDEMTRM
ncbi:hypothetical protein [Pseudomarimonas salicorniae]|uniref:tRNA_anti-like n=1 Tax=Pseudomarimonas salicorniae TaxID=2933270 RepID=A0ABT0GKQ1_9GAMM|nr:hypothetical protein [Lysobacter sp. CAU 1642]MCK7595121.1 hypothetical protein [Lysobacter sp. CAU 1642]